MSRQFSLPSGDKSQTVVLAGSASIKGGSGACLLAEHPLMSCLVFDPVDLLKSREMGSGCCPPEAGSSTAVHAPPAHAPPSLVSGFRPDFSAPLSVESLAVTKLKHHSWAVTEPLGACFSFSPLQTMICMDWLALIFGILI